ncbi:hypothetical protein GGR50DRAFT_495294 [Xylaria sp. CBS 124048]|nr:hypothetical protein GGR50DRAFT_495294 [Xylaria sp. CBS 124048]
MEFSNTYIPSRRERILSQSKEVLTYVAGAGSRYPRKPSLNTNFSYPKLSRHESNESRSSNGSIPGMTDASDSDLSFDEDGLYNTSAGELWDKFWYDDEASSPCRRSQMPDQDLLQPEQRKLYTRTTGTGQQRSGDAMNSTVRTACNEYGTDGTTYTTSCQSTPKKSPVKYSIYPKVPAMQAPRHPPPPPPRISSLTGEPPLSPPPRSSFLRGSRSNLGLKLGRPSSNSKSSTLVSTSIAPPSRPSSLQPPPSSSSISVSAPVSPVYPSPPPKELRPTTSSFSLRDKTQLYSNKSNKSNKGNMNNKNSPASHHATGPPPTPPVSLLPSALPPSPSPRRLQAQQSISVFDFDSDSEGGVSGESGNFARRIARGLHKKSSSEKRSFDRKAFAGCLPPTDFSSSLTSSSSDKVPEEKKSRDSDVCLRRKRGGSLGRIFGLRGKKCGCPLC